jgi:hypothetical protein
MLDMPPSELHFTDFLTGQISNKWTVPTRPDGGSLGPGAGCVRTSLERIWRIYLRSSIAIGMRWLQSD